MNTLSSLGWPIFIVTLFLLLIVLILYVVHRGQKTMGQSLENSQKTMGKELHDQLDGRLSQLLEVTTKLAHSQGVVIGRAEQKAEQALEDNKINVDFI